MNRKEALITLGVIGGITMFIWLLTVVPAENCGVWNQLNGSVCYPRLAELHGLMGAATIMVALAAGLVAVFRK